MFPNHQSQNFEFSEGSKWSYEHLYAEKDFQADIKITNEFDSLIQKTINYSKGQVIISPNAFINNESNQVLTQYFNNIQGPKNILSSDNWIYFLGYFILTALVIVLLLSYAKRYFPEIFVTVRKLSFLLIWPILFSGIVFFIEKSSGLSPYMIPFCIVPIVVLNFFDSRLALILHISVVLIASFLCGLGYEFTFLQILAGLVTVLIVSETRYWNKFFIAILIILATYLIGYMGLSLINSGSLTSNEYPVFGWLTVNALLLLLAYPFIPIIEKVFGFTSTITLAELGDMNNPLLRDLSLKAPGTLQHSLQVSNLAESAARAIGANSLLVKVAALYHDIGKIDDPLYYIENSKGENLHNNLNNFESAKKIIDHVVLGEVMAKKAKLPRILIDFITTHHGTTRVEYFYRNQLNSEPEREFDETLFRYPGPNPSTKEQSILMLADSIEAASKSLKNPTGQDIDNLVDKIVAFKIEQNQLTDSALTFSELNECLSIFKSLLRSIYHVRVEYPEEKS